MRAPMRLPSHRRENAFLRLRRLAAERPERSLLEPLAPQDRSRFIKYLALIAAAAEHYANGNGIRPPRRPPATKRL